MVGVRVEEEGEWSAGERRSARRDEDSFDEKGEKRRRTHPRKNVDISTVLRNVLQTRRKDLGSVAVEEAELETKSDEKRAAVSFLFLALPSPSRSSFLLKNVVLETHLLSKIHDDSISH